MKFSVLRSLLLALVTSITVASSFAAEPAVKVEGQSFPARLQIANADLKLNGVGLRAVAWLKAYAAALYLTQKSSTTAQVMASPGPKRLEMRMMVDVGAVEFVKAFDKGVTRNTSAADLPALRERMLAFEQRIQGLGKVRKGDVIVMDWVPGVGMNFTVNGAAKGTPIAGEDFYAAMLKTFIGDVVSDAELKTGLLGGPTT
jgi:Chalcone isomerase-like